MRKTVLNKIVYFILIVNLLHGIEVRGQDSISIYLIPGDVAEDEWYHESITFNENDIYFEKFSMPAVRRSRIKLNRYKIFFNFLKTNITHKKIISLSKFFKKKEKEIMHQCEWDFEVCFDFHYKKHKHFYYEIRLYKGCDITYPNYVSLFRIVEFWEQFFKEHGCEKRYFVHTVKKGETLSSVAKHYEVSEEILIQYISLGFDEFEKINDRDIDIWEVYDGKTNLQPNDKLLIPCIPQKVSKYE